MRIAVGSTNPVKVKAVEEVLRAFYPEAEVFGVEVDSKVKAQPLGMEETVHGAVNRAREALEHGELGVGIEAGLVEVPFTLTGYMDVQFCAISDGEVITLGAGSGFEYPPQVAREVLRGRTVGEVMEELSGIANIGRRGGAIGFLSHGKLSRRELTKQAVLMAMLPRINRELYEI
ncbi:inosine/xanthosine triphosphatase [Candidatus Pyrohabitans sp.]